MAISWSLAIATGEVFTLLSTAERLTAAREASQAPLRQAVEARQKLETRVAKAEAAVAALPEASARFQAAMQSKAAADAAVVTKSAERGCAANCRLLLQAQADQNQQEVEAARRDMAEQQDPAGAGSHGRQGRSDGLQGSPVGLPARRSHRLAGMGA